MNNDRYIFKGKRKDDGEWVQGFFYKIWDECYILWGMTNGIPNMTKVDPETIGRCTGLKDKRGTLIFEGDIVRGRNEYEISNVICKDGVWTLSMFAGHAPALWEIQPVEVIGNIWDNPELIPKNFI